MILAGGASTRMGRDKAWIELKGLPLILRQIQLAREAGAEEVLISGQPGQDYSQFGVRVIPDEAMGMGPLAGIAPSLEAAATEWVWLQAVDMPRMNADFVRKLISRCSEARGGVPRHGGRAEPLAALYPRTMAAMAREHLKAGQRSVTRWAEEGIRRGLLDWLEVDVREAEHFANWNSPADIAEPLE